jgi:enoyl-CoA hydratase/carnithine racemase
MKHSMSNLERVTLTIEQDIALVTLNRADKHNALDMAMYQVLDQTIKRLRNNRNLRAVVVTGAGDDFCTGIDIKSMLSSKKNAIKLLFKLWPGSANLAQRVALGWRTIPCPVIFAIQGRCWGGGLQIALGGDFRFATPDSNWSIMETRWGIIPDMAGTVMFHELMRQDQLKRLVYTGEQIDGITAQQLGLVSELHQQPLTAALEFANELAERSPDALAAAKKLIQHAWRGSNGLTLLRESYYQIKILLGKNQRIATNRERAKMANKALPKYQLRRFK